MLKKIYQELVLIRRELKGIRNSVDVIRTQCSEVVQNVDGASAFAMKKGHVVLCGKEVRINPEPIGVNNDVVF